METFDDISCEEYSQIYDEQADFQAWIRDVEQALQDDANRELRELAAAKR